MGTRNQTTFPECCKGYPICAFYSITYFGTSCNYPVKFEKAALIFCYFFESFCFSIKNPSVYAGLRHFIFTIKYHILQNFIVFSAFSLCFYQHFSDAYCIYGSIFFITVLPAKHYLLPRAIFCFYKKQKNCRSSPGSFFFYSFYLLSIRSLYSSKSA